MEAVADWTTAVAEAVETAVGEGEKKLSRSSSSSSDGDQMHSGGSPKEVLKSSGKTIAPTQETNIIIIPDVMDKTLILNRNSSSYNNNNSSTAPSTVSILDIGGGTNVGYQKLAQDEQDLYLETLYQLPEFHKFYCPHCNYCLSKVIILRDSSSSLSGLKGGETQLPVSTDEVTEVPRSPQLNVIERAPIDLEISTREEGGSIRCCNCFSFLAPLGDWISSQFGFRSAISDGTGAPELTTPRKGRVLHSIFPQSSSQDVSSVAVIIPPSSDQAAVRTESGGKSLEIIKSIVYGGLTEAITSLGIVTSAASAKTPTENIVALALANLITGLIVIMNNLSGLKSNQVKKESNETNEPHVDPYEEALGDRDHYLLHYTISILSFLLFGLLPPLVYGFSFRDTDDGDLKLAAVAVTSLLCIALLAIGKAYVSKQHTWKEFIKTLVYYISLGFGASGLSYLAGKEFNILLEQLGWFKKDPMAPTLLLPNMNYAKPAWGSI